MILLTLALEIKLNAHVILKNQSFFAIRITTSSLIILFRVMVHYVMSYIGCPNLLAVLDYLIIWRGILRLWQIFCLGSNSPTFVLVKSWWICHTLVIDPSSIYRKIYQCYFLHGSLNYMKKHLGQVDQLQPCACFT